MAAPGRNPWARRVRRAAAAFWLNYLFWHVRHSPRLMQATKGFYLWFCWRYSDKVKDGTLTNARRLLPPGATEADRVRFGKSVVRNFVSFVFDVARSRRMKLPQLLKRIEAVEGHENYAAARAPRRGAIVVTAHMGSFEAGLAALLEQEKDGRRIHVVFRRDTMRRFEDLRSELRRNLGIAEAALDDGEGWSVWVRLRDALRNDEVVVLQGDRVMPGQKGQAVPFLGGHVMLPSGPIKLALASGSPIVPVFSVRTRRGKVRLFVEEPILVSPDDGPAPGTGGVHPALLRLAALIEKYVKAHPDQWLILERAWVEDAVPART